MSENQSPTGAPALDDFGLEPTPVAQTPTAPAIQPPVIPAKYQGKSIEDLIEMHQNAERRLSQQGNELGEVRRMADRLIGVKPTENAKTVARTPVTVDSLLSNPDQALASSIEQSEVARRVEAAVARVDSLEKSVAQRAFEGAYPSFQQDMNDPNFMDWVRKNRVRSTLAQAAYQGNYEAASDLWSLWDEAKGAQAPAATTQPNKALAAAKVARQGATADGTPPRTYSRAKLMELRERVQDGDPASVAKWNDQAFQAALTEAYREGRVK